VTPYRSAPAPSRAPRAPWWRRWFCASPALGARLRIRERRREAMRRHGLTYAQADALLRVRVALFCEAKRLPARVDPETIEEHAVAMVREDVAFARAFARAWGAG